MAEPTKTTSRPLELTELLTLMLEVSERITSTLDLDELMRRIAEVVKRAIDYEIFAILLLNEKTQELRVHFSIGHPDQLVRHLKIKVGEGIVGRAAQQRRSILVNDVLKDPTYIQTQPSIRSELAVPLMFRNHLIGIIDLEAAEADFFNESHVNLLELLASRMAMAIENARLYRRSLRQARKLQLLNEISRELSSVLVLNELLRLSPLQHLPGRRPHANVQRRTHFEAGRAPAPEIHPPLRAGFGRSGGQSASDAGRGGRLQGPALCQPQSGNPFRDGRAARAPRSGNRRG
jgi:putative methionine-R-sulfoxide reductase with GAF domain